MTVDEIGTRNPHSGIETTGLEGVSSLRWNLPSAELVETAIRRGEGRLSAHGALVVTTGRHDPCVGIRAVPIAEAMMALVLVDHLLRDRAQNGPRA